MNDKDRLNEPTLANLEAKYGNAGGHANEGPENDMLPAEEPLDKEAVRAFAKTDAVEAMGLARAWRNRRAGSPCVEIASSPTFSTGSMHGQRLEQARNENWPDDLRDAYYDAFVLDLAAGNVALIQALSQDAEWTIGTYVVDLNDWEWRDGTFPLGKTWQTNEPLNAKWRARSRRLRFRRWFKGQK